MLLCLSSLFSCDYELILLVKLLFSKSNMNYNGRKRYLKVSNVGGDYCRDGADLILTDSGATDSNEFTKYQWEFIDSSSGSRRIRSVYCHQLDSGVQYVLSPQGNACANDKKIILKPWTNHNNQKWLDASGTSSNGFVRFKGMSCNSKRISVRDDTFESRLELYDTQNSETVSL